MEQKKLTVQKIQELKDQQIQYENNKKIKYLQKISSGKVWNWFLCVTILSGLTLSLVTIDYFIHPNQSEINIHAQDGIEELEVGLNVITLKISEFPHFTLPSSAWLEISYSPSIIIEYTPIFKEVKRIAYISHEKRLDYIETKHFYRYFVFFILFFLVPIITWVIKKHFKPLFNMLYHFVIYFYPILFLLFWFLDNKIGRFLGAFIL